MTITNLHGNGPHAIALRSRACWGAPHALAKASVSASILAVPSNTLAAEDA